MNDENTMVCKLVGALDNGGRIDAKLEVKNYFSFTTDRGADTESIKKAIPELADYIDLHLSSLDGRPMHAVANAAFHASEENVESLARHLRIPEPYAREFIDEMRWFVKDGISQEREKLEGIISRWAQQVGKFLNDRPNDYLGYERWIKDVRLVLREFFNLRPGNSKIIKKSLVDSRLDPDHYIDGNVLAAIIYIDDPDQLKFLDSVRRPLHPSFRSRAGASLDTLMATFRDMRRNVEKLSSSFSFDRKEKLFIDQYRNEFWERTIESCFSSCWARQASELMEWCETHQEETFYSRTFDECCGGSEVTFENSVLISGERYKVTDIIPRDDNAYGLPLLDLGYSEYYVAEDRGEAAEAVKGYFRDMMEHSPEEFVCIVGEEVLVDWALGRPSKAGGAKSLDEFLEAIGKEAPLHLAGYDGKEVEILIHRSVAEEIGIDSEGKDWVSVLGYKNA